MDDRPGPSSAAPVAQDPALLAKADAQFEEGVASIKSNEMEKAVRLFAEVLKVRTAHYGETAPECASAYYRYGSALLYQAQDSVDVLGAPLGGEDQDVADEKENDERGSRPGSAAAEGGGGGGAAPGAAPADDKGKGKALVEEGEEGQQEEEEGSEGEAAESDLQLAWENLEVAKSIWEQQAEGHRQELADVHLLLGDVGCENEDFDGALADYDKALGYLQAAGVEGGDRRLAEVQYKRCMALQFLDRPQEALEAVQAATACLKERRGQLREALTAAEPDSEEAQRAQREMGDVEGLLGELADKVEELNDVMEQHLSTKNALQSALETISKMEQQKAAAGAGAGGSGATEQAGFDRPAGGSGSAAGAAAGAGAAAAPAPVKDLGVVGRGTKRLNLAPVQVNAGPAPAGPAEAPAAKKKRSLEDLMGGEGKDGETTVGFGAPTSQPPAAAPAAAPAPAAALPAFLQPAAVKAVYGGGEAGGAPEPAGTGQQ